MNEYGYAMHGDRIYPEAILNSHDAYNDKLGSELSDVYGMPVRYMVRYKKQFTMKHSLVFTQTTAPKCMASTSWAIIGMM